MTSDQRLMATHMCLLFGTVLCLWLAPAARAEHSPGPSDVMKTDSQTDTHGHGFKSDDDQQQTTNHGKDKAQTGKSKTIKGELVKVEEGTYFVKSDEGKELRLHADKKTKMIGTVAKGEHIEATITDQNHALSIRAIK